MHWERSPPFTESVQDVAASGGRPAAAAHCRSLDTPTAGERERRRTTPVGVGRWREMDGQLKGAAPRPLAPVRALRSSAALSGRWQSTRCWAGGRRVLQDECELNRHWRDADTGPSIGRLCRRQGRHRRDLCQHPCGNNREGEACHSRDQEGMMGGFKLKGGRGAGIGDGGCAAAVACGCCHPPPPCIH